MFVVLFLNAAIVNAAITEEMDFQGKVVNSDGTNVSDGFYDFVVKVYDGAGSSATAIHTENWTSANLLSTTMTTAPSSGGESLVYSSDTNEDSLHVGQVLWNSTKNESVIITSVDTSSNTLGISPTQQAWATTDTITNRIYVKDGIFTIPINTLQDADSLSASDFNQRLYVGVNFNSDGEMKPRMELTAAPYAFNASVLDGVDSTSFLRSDTSDNYTSGTLAFNSGTTLDINGDITIADGTILLDNATSTDITATGDLSFNTDDLFIDKSTSSVGIGDTTPDHTLDVAGNIGLDASGYINFGDTDGTSGYGFRDSSGSMQYKNSSGLWTNFGSASSVAWSGLQNPTANLSLSMSNYTTAFTWGSATGTSNLFALTDSASNTGTGYLLNLATATGSTLNLLNIDAASTNALFINSSGQAAIGADTISNSGELEVVGNVVISDGDLTCTSGYTDDGDLCIDNDLEVGGNITTGTITVGGGGSITIGNLDPNKLTATDANSQLISTDLVDWVAGTSNEIDVADDSAGGITLSLPNSVYLGASGQLGRDANNIIDFTTDGTISFTDGTNTLVQVYDAGTVGNVYATGGISTYNTTVADNTIETGQLCLGDGTNCITDWGSAGTTYWQLSSNVVNTTSATYDFAIGGSSLAASMFGIDESAGNFYFGYDNSANPTLLFEATDGDAGSFGFNTNDAFYFSDANVGIGTTAPTQLLDVFGNMRLDGFLYDENNSAGSAGQVLSTTTTGVDWVDSSGVGTDNQDLANVYQQSGNAVQMTDTYGDVRFYNDASREMLFLDESSGNVGIGTTSPSTNLHIYATSSPQLEVEAGSTDTFAVMKTVSDSANGVIETKGSTYSASGILAPSQTILGMSQGDGGLLILNQVSSGFINFATGGYATSDEAMRITSDHNVGIGTTSPSAPLNVVDTNTGTSGYQKLAYNHLYANPSASATVTFFGLDSVVDTTGISNDITTGGVTGARGYAYIPGDSAISTVKGIEGIAFKDSGSGDVTDMYAGYFSASADGTGTTSNLYGVDSYVQTTDGTATTVYGYHTKLDIAGTSTTNAYGLYVDYNTITTPTTGYGIYLDDVSGTTNYGIYQSGSDDVNYFAGNVGIGATSPSAKLEIDTGAVATIGQIIKPYSTVGSVTFSGTGLNDATSGGTFTGTSTINYKIEIDGTGTPDTFKWSDDGGTTWDATGVAITGSAQTLNHGVTITFGATTGHTLGDYWTFTATAPSGDLAQFQNPAGSSIGGMTYNESGIAFNTDNLFVDKSTGNVGIGTTLPSAPLNVVDTKTGTSGYQKLAYNHLYANPSATATATATFFGLDSVVDTTGITNDITSGGGLVGVRGVSYDGDTGSQSVDSMIGVYGIGDKYYGTGTASSIVGGEFYARVNSGSATNIYGSKSKVETTLAGVSVTNAYANYSLVSSAYGSVTNAYGSYIDWESISTPTNGYGLYIDDIVATTDYGIYQSGSDDVNYFAGDVGIGTTSPSQMLEISGGDIQIDNTTHSNEDGIIYKGSTPFIHNFNYGDNGTVTTNGHNTFVGLNAGNLTMGSTAALAYYASYNTGIGDGALNSDTTGFYNTAIGYNSMNANTEGHRNTAVGYHSLAANTTAQRNTAVGYGVMALNTTGESNVALGVNALHDNVSNNYNTAIGTEALRYSTDGYNTAVGGLSLYENTTGTAGTGIGYHALFSNTTGNYNIGIGYDALYGNTDGAFNIAIGVSAGKYITGGSTANTTGDYNIFIGQDTKANADNDQNEIVIGYNATGLGSNTVVLGNDSITTTALNGNVGIGTTSPSANLDIASTKTSGNIIAIGADSAVTLDGTLAGLDIDLSTNYTATNYTVHGANITLPSVSNAGSGSYHYEGLYVDAGGTLTNSGSGVSVFKGVSVDTPDVDESSGGATAIGFSTTLGNITGTGEQMGVLVGSGGVTAGTSYAFKADSITAGAGTEYGLYIGTGWDYGVYSTTTGDSYFAGDVGIGTTSPSTALDVNGTITATDIACTDCLDFTELADAMTLDANTSIDLYDGSADQDFTIKNSNSTDYFFFADGSTGQVTIGASSTYFAGPKFQVVDFPSATSGTSFSIYGYSEADPSAASSATNIGVEGVAKTYSFNSQNVTGDIIGVKGQGQHRGSGTASNIYGGYFDIYADNGDVTNAYGVYIKDFGGSGTITNNYGLFQTSSNQTNYFAGNVGIGDSSPDHTLDVAGNIGLDASGYINFGDTDGSSGYGFRDNAGTLEYKNSGGSWAALGGGGSSPWTDGGTYLYPTSAEVLGNSASAGSNKIAGLYLGDSSPLYFGADNDVNYSFSGTTLAVAMGSNDINYDANTLFIDGSADRVGIGTTTPSTALDVNGTVTATDFSCTDCLEQGNIADSAIGRGELKTTSGEVSGSSVGQVTLPGGQYGFYPESKRSSTCSALVVAVAGSTASTTYSTDVTISQINSCTAYFQQTYVQASPPYYIDGYLMPHFIYILRDKDTNKILASYQAEDPPWDNNGGDPEKLPHPFHNYVGKSLPDNIEIDLIDASNINELKQQAQAKGLSLLEYIQNFMQVDPTDVTPPISPNTGKSIKLPLQTTWRKLMLKPNADSIEVQPAVPATQDSVNDGVDIAENFPGTFLEPGDVVDIVKAREAKPWDDKPDYVLVKSDKPYSSKSLGIISTNPAQVLSVGGSDGQLPLALNGRVPVKVIVTPDSIKVGDIITTSMIEGIAIKAIQPGYAVAKSLENTDSYTLNSCSEAESMESIIWPEDNGDNADRPCFKVPVSSFSDRVRSEIEKSEVAQDGYVIVGKIMAFVNLSWQDPTITVGDDGVLVDRSTGKAIYLELKAEDIIANTLTAKEAQIDNLSVDSLSIEGVSLSDYVSQIVGPNVNTDAPTVAMGTADGDISLSSEIASLTISDSLTSTGITKLADTVVAGNLSVEGDITGSLGDLTFQGQKIVMSKDGDLTLVGGVLSAKEVKTDKVVTSKVETKDLSITNNQSVGTITMPVGETSIIVSTSNITMTSKIFLTPNIPVAAAVTSRKVGESFTIIIEKPLDSKLNVDWFIIN